MSCKILFKAKTINMSHKSIEIFVDILRKYCERSTVNGFKLLHTLWNNTFYRNLWIIIIVLHFINIFYHMGEIVNQVKEFPVSTSMQGTAVPISNVMFPAIAICNVNKISRKAVEKYSQQLCNLAPKHCANDANFWLNRMPLLRGYYDANAVRYDDGLYFQLLLEDVLIDYSQESQDTECAQRELNVTRLLEKLAPKCEDMIIECKMPLQKERNCSQLFTMRVTSMGFCCIFNNNKHQKQDESLYVEGVGPRHGLTVLLNTSTEDYFFKSHNWNGMQVEIYSSYATPEISTGELISAYISAGTDTDIILKSYILNSDSNLRYLRPKTRDCYFRNEPMPFMSDSGEPYTFTACLFMCKIYNIINMCKCVPFMADLIMRQRMNVTMPDCTLEFIDCMQQYDVAFHTYRLRTWTPSNVPPKVGEFQNIDSLDCSFCLPDCEGHFYSYVSENRRFGKPARRYINQKYNNTSELALVQFFFQENSVLRYRKHFTSSFTRLLADHAGILNINMGVSIISILEFSYYFAFLFIVNLFKHYYKLIKNVFMARN